MAEGRFEGVNKTTARHLLENDHLEFPVKFVPKSERRASIALAVLSRMKERALWR